MDNYVDARDFNRWLPVEMAVPCGGCTLCCRGDAVRIHEELGDNPHLYQTETIGGHACLAHKPNGDCVYLDRARRCIIHSVHPAVCRELDCRVFLIRFTRKELDRMVRRGLLSDGVIRAARRLRRRYGIPEVLRNLVRERDQ